MGQVASEINKMEGDKEDMWHPSCCYRNKILGDQCIHTVI